MTMNIPNILTMLRFVMTLLFVYIYPQDILLASIMFFLAAMTDFFDGYLARKYNRITAFGKIADPIADKFLILVALFFVLQPWSDKIPILFFAFLIVAIREVGVTAFRFFAMAKGKVLAAEKAGKAKTVLQMISIILGLLFNFLQNTREGHIWFHSLPRWLGFFFMHTWLLGLIIFAAAVIVTLLSGVLVVWNNRKLFSS